MQLCEHNIEQGVRMSMNTRDERLYHYEYRRPRPYNPTYNSNHVFDSLNMFIRNDLPSALTSSQQRYSLPKSHPRPMHDSAIMDYGSNRPLQNYSTISTQLERPKQNSYLTDRDQRYLGMVSDMRRNPQVQRSSSRRGSANPEAPPSRQLEDSLSRQLHDFQTIRK